jgi:hypothetical protein
LPADITTTREDERVPETTPRKFRVDDALWNAAIQAARENRESLSAVIRRALVDYIRAAGREVPK